MTLRVLLADDGQGVLAAMADLFRSDDRFEVVALAGDGDRAVLAAAESRPDVAIVDWSMEGGGRGIIRRLRNLDPSMRVIVFSAQDTGTTVRAALGEGAAGFLVKGSASVDICEYTWRTALASPGSSP